MINKLLNFIASFYKPQRLPDKMDTWCNYQRSKWEQRIWQVNGWEYVHKPNWYLKKEDSRNGARCAECDKWIERKNENSLQVHELDHYL